MPTEVDHFLDEQYGYIGAVEYHVDDEVEVEAAFRLAVEEVKRPRASEREIRGTRRSGLLGRRRRGGWWRG